MFSKCRYVYELYKEQSFTDASKKLFISQPSLSAAIKNIEKKIGAQLSFLIFTILKAEKLFLVELIMFHHIFCRKL